MLRFPCTQSHKTPRKYRPEVNRSSCCLSPSSLSLSLSSSLFACVYMTHLVLVIIASFLLGSFFASMAEANDSELEQEKQKNKNPIVENDSYPVVDCDGDDPIDCDGDDSYPVVDCDGDDSYPVVDCDGVAVENDYFSIGSSGDDEVGEHSMKKKRKKKKREIFISREKKAEEDSAKNKQDPLMLFGSDILMKILRNLDARSVALSLLVSRGWYGVASSDRLWTTKCEELWLGKAHIPRSAQVRGLSKLATYSISVMDGRRTRIMKEDLCDHVWEFHFHEAAPEYWRNLDPYWKGTGPPMRRYFHPDGSLTADPGDEVWGGHESCYSIVTSVIGDGSIRDHYVRINRWPRMLVMRKEDWSWEMSNNLYCYSSIPDADKEGGTGSLFPFS